MLKKLSTRKVFLFIVLLLAGYLVAVVTVAAYQVPSHNKNWKQDQAILPYAIIREDEVEIKNVRNFSYRSTEDFIPNYYDKVYDLNSLSSVDYVVEPLASVAAAHTFLSFGFDNGDRVAISVETRKEESETFSPIKGVLNEYELMYVVFDERDALPLRAIHRDHPVYVYPTHAKPEAIRQLFVNMLQRVNDIKETPEFYNTFTNSCATNIADHINEVTPGTVPWDYRLLLPKESDALAYELGFIDNSISLKEAREKFYVNGLVKEYADHPDFSRMIRENFD